MVPVVCPAGWTAAPVVAGRVVAVVVGGMITSGSRSEAVDIKAAKSGSLSFMKRMSFSKLAIRA